MNTAAHSHAQAPLKAHRVANGQQVIRRTFDAALLNEVANDPDVKAVVAQADQQEAEINLALAVEHPANVALVSSQGGFLCLQHEPGIYELHTIFRPGRGRHVLRALRAALVYLFVETDCTELLTRIPATNTGAASFARHVGFAPRFTRAAAWVTANGAADVSFEALLLLTWALRSDETKKAGEEFHSTLTAAKRATGSTTPEHPDDPIHDAVVGAATLMLKAGNAAKALRFYNAWARFAGYHPVEMVSLHPPIIDIGDAIVSFRGNNMEIVTCRSE